MNKRTLVERDLIASILYYPERLSKLRYSLRPDSFSVDLYRRTYEAALRLTDDRVEVTQENVAVVAELSEPEVTELIAALSVEGRTAEPRLLAKALAEEIVLGKFLDLKVRITELADPFELVKASSEIESEALSIINAHARKDKLQTLHDYAAYILQNSENGVKRIPTGLRTLDSILNGGLSIGNLSLLGGRPGDGKTSLALLFALNGAKAGHRTVFLEGEMPSQEILERLNGIETGEDIDRIRTGREFDRLTRDFVSKQYDLPLTVVEAFDRDPYSITSLIKQAALEGAELIVLDYLQVYAGHGKQASDEFYAIKKLSESLRGLALKLNIHLLVLSSLNRNEVNSDKPGLNSLYGSSGLGHDCSLGMLLTGEQKDTDELLTRERFVTLSIVKNRQGCRGKINLLFKLTSQRFEEVTGSPVPSSAGFAEVDVE